MTASRFSWWATATLLTALGAAVAFVSWSLSISLLIFGCGGLTAASIALVAETEDISTQRRAAVITKTAALAGIGTVALAGLGALFGVAAIAVVAAMAASSPPAIGYYCRRVRAARPPGPDAVDGETDKDAVAEATNPEHRPPTEPIEPATPLPVPVETGPRDMDDAALCRAWRRSYWALKETASSAGRLRIVQARQGYLDELERRYPGGMADWLESAAKPAADPGAYLTNDRTQTRPQTPRISNNHRRHTTPPGDNRKEDHGRE